MDTTIEIPGYRIEQPIGSGAMATVYLAIQESLERRVALKVMATSLMADPSFAQRFLKEGKIVGQLNHPNVVTIYDIGEYRKHYYMAMEYISGGTLKQRIKEGLTPKEAVEIFCQVASALGYAHTHGFIHRDVKPANVLFRENGTCILSDFGIAKALGGESTQLTAVGLTVGTPSYMSPEQALGRTVDARSDLYSLGVVFYEMMTGIKPYQSEDSFTTALMHVNSPLPKLPKELAVYQSFMDRLLAKEPNDRFERAEEAIASLRKIPVPDIAAMEPTQHFQTPPKKPKKTGSTKPRSHTLLWALGLGLLAPAAGTLAYFLLQPAPPPTPPEGTTPSAEAADPYVAPLPPLDDRTRQQIAILLDIASAHRQVGRLTAPPGSNAAENYRRVLELDPNNLQAKAGLKAIADEYADRARESLKKQEPLITSLELVEAGLSAVSNHADLRQLQDQIRRQLDQPGVR